MKLLKTSTLLLCMTASGCSYFQTQDASSQPAKAPAEQASSHSWWPFGKDDGQTVAKQATEQKAEAEHVGSSHWWWPFGKDEGGRDVAAKAAEQKAEIAAAKKEVAAAAEPKAANSFNPKRHTMLMPITLNPLGKVAKMAQADPQSGILVLGHTDSTGSKAVNDKLSFERAQSVAAIFRLSGLKGDQLRLKGVGSDMPRADNASAAGRAQNRRVEVLYTQRASLLSLAQGN